MSRNGEGGYMAYNRADYVKIRDEFSQKYKAARELADARRQQIHSELPEVFGIDRELSRTGLEIMKIISSKSDVELKVKALEKKNNALLAERRRLLADNGYPEDYTDVHYECEKCGDTGYVDTIMCDCMKNALVKAGYRSSGLGALIGEQSFANFKLDYYSEENGIRAHMKRDAELLERFARNFTETTYENFIMTGRSGLGKTHLSTAVAQAVIDRGFDVLYVTSIGMGADFEAKRFGTSAGLAGNNDVSRYYSADLLIIDDFGTEVVNKFTQAYIYDVINSRINLRRCTIINTNLSATEISSLYTERISSRILGEYIPIKFVGTDIRKQKTVGK